MVEYDSIASSQDSGSAFALYNAVGMEYFFLNNERISEMNRYNQSGKLETSIGIWHSNYSELFTVSLASQNDTVEVERYFWDKWNRDSVYESIINYGSPFESHEKDYYGYNSSGKLKRIFTVDVKTTDTVYWYRYFYNSLGQLDSIIAGNGSGKVLLKNVIERTSRVESVYILGDLPPSVGFDTVVQYMPNYNSGGLVDEIFQINYAFVQTPSLIDVLRFYKKPNSTIGLPENETQRVSVYPNPVKDYFVLEISADADAVGEVQLLNAVGQLYNLKVEQHAGALRVDVSTLPSGFYLGSYINPSGKPCAFKLLK